MDQRDNWTCNQTQKLIQSYKSFPNLWDCNHEHYKNKVLRKNCLKSIATEVCQVKSNTTIDDVRAKLKTLRSQFGKEKYRKEEGMMKGLVHRPKLWCYNELKFIDVELKPPVDSEAQPAGNKTADLEENIEEFLDNVESDAEQIDRSSKLNAWNWTKEQTFTLLRLLQKYHLLYDRSHPLYRHPIHRARSTRDLLNELRPFKPDLTIDEMRSKIKTLRSQYNKEKRKQQINKESKGCLQYAPTLWCFEHLKFLDQKGNYGEDHIKELKQSLEKKSEEFQVGEEPDDCYVEENENEIYVNTFDDSDDPSSQPPSPTNKNAKLVIPRSILHKKCLSLVDSLTKHMSMERHCIHQNQARLQTPQALLAKMVELELLKVSQDIFEDTQWKIIKLLEEASKRNRGANLT